MIRRLRPPDPPLSLLDAARPARAALEAYDEQAARTKSQRRWPIDASIVQQPEVVEALGLAFDGKCAYCEAPVDPAVVDWFRPSQEAANPDGTVDRDHYWWLAYDWDNLLPSCQACLSYKGSRFPVAGRRAPIGSTGDALLAESAMVLDPYTDEPERHLAYQPDGVVFGDERSMHTIDVLGLNRTELVEARRAAMAEVDQVVEGVLTGAPTQATSSGADPLTFVSPLRSAVADRAPFAGCRRYALRRAILERALGQTLFTEDTGPFDAARLLGLDDEQALDVAARSLAPMTTAEPPPPPVRGAAGSEPLGTERLEVVEIRNFKAIEHVRLQFPPPAGDGSQQPWLLLLGENGVGKSSALKAIALAFASDNERRAFQPDARDVVRRGRDRPRSGKVVLTFSGGSVLELAFSKSSPEFRVTGAAPPQLVLGYGPTRLPPEPETATPEPRRIHIDNLFDPRAPLRDVERWLVDTEAVSTRRFNLAATDLKELLPMEDDDQIVRRQGRIFKRSREATVPLRELSDGFRSVVAFATDMMLHLSAEFESMRQAEALVLLDELEVHLHPTWRMEIVTLLRKVFPKVRVVATTHDPLCLQQTEPGEVVVVRRDDAGRVEAVVRDVPKGLRADQLLTGDWFGLATTTDADTVAKIEQHGRLLLQPRSAPNRRRRRDLESELRTRLGTFADTSVERLALGVVAQVTAERALQEIDPGGRAELRRQVLERVKARQSRS